MTKGQEGRPPDGGWGWMVIAGSFLTLLVLGMFSLGYSILFSEFLISCGASSTTIAWIFNLHLFLWNAVAVFAGPLAKELGFRKVSMASTFLAGLSLLALIFADSIWYLLVFFAFGGLFGGLATTPCFLLLTLYFDRKRGRANALLMVGTCMAQFVGPLLIRYLLAEYSLKGATLILAGIVFNSLVGTALFHPVEWHMKKNDAELNTKKEDGREDDADAEVTEMRVKEDERSKMLGGGSPYRPIMLLGMSSRSLYVNQSFVKPSSRRGSLVLENTASTTNEDAPNTSFSAPGFFNGLARVVKNVASDMKILKSPRALIIVLGGVSTITSYFNFLMVAPFAIQHLGYSLSEAAWCMSFAAITNFAARIIASALSDQAWFNMRLVYMAGALTICLTTAVFGFLRDLTYIQIAMAVWGCGVGINLSLHVLIMPRFMGVGKMPAIFGVQSLAVSVSMIILGPIFGFIRDWSQSYLVCMVAMGCSAGVSVLLWCLMPAAVAYDKRVEEEQRRREQQEELDRKV